MFEFVRDRGDIICLQETHSCKDTARLWANEWGGVAQFAHGTSLARGVCILIKRGLPYNITKIQADNEGRYIVCEIQDSPDQGGIALLNLYGPNCDRPDFFNKIAEELAGLSERKIVIGDFTLVLNVGKDRLNSRCNNDGAREVVKEMMGHYMLEDVWRCRNENSVQFSWNRFKPHRQGSRIDFALVSQGLHNMVENPMYLHSVLTDHMGMFLAVNTTQNKRGPGYWKMNSSLLTRVENITTIKDCITKDINSSENMPATKRWLFIKKQSAEHLKKTFQE